VIHVENLRPQSTPDPLPLVFLAGHLRSRRSTRDHHSPSAAPLALALAVGLLGCSRARVLSPSELSLAQQMAAVRSGEADEIRVELTAFTEGEFQALAGLENLRTLILDDPTAFLSPAALAAFDDLPRLEHLRVRGGGLGDSALAQIARLKSLRILNLPRAQFADAALTHLQALPALEQLRFGSPHVTDAGMTTIAALPALKRLHLINIPLTDAGLATLAAIPQLESLYIDGGQFSDAALDDLFRRRPDLHVHFNQRHHDYDPQKHPHP
jgi:hypothetical protein